MSESRIRELQQEVATLRARQRLAELTDAAVERALRQRLSLRRALPKLFDVLVTEVGAMGAWVRTHDESLEVRDFFWQHKEVPVINIGDLAVEIARAGTLQTHGKNGSWIAAQVLDVAGDPFGCAALVMPQTPTREQGAELEVLLKVWCEELDNFLGGIANAARKQQTANALADALMHPILDSGIDQALKILHDNVQIGDLLLVYRHGNTGNGEGLDYKVVKSGKVVLGSREPTDPELDAFLRNHGLEMLQSGDTRAVTERFGFENFSDELLITGLKHGAVVGRILASGADGHELSAFDRDLIELFADFLRQRILDFNREWAQLSLCFPQPVVRRLLEEEDYAARHLTPRERKVAVLFADISGFTRVSEQVLRAPPLVGELINRWSARAVEIIWEQGGVFDKIVGDCVIALWGPPYCELPARQLCERAARAAIAIRDFTRALSGEGGMDALQGLDPPLGVATGLNYCPLYVGRFGPNEDYTGFSSGMNNTARLQGVANHDEILCMESFVQTIGDGATFGELQHASVKNVAEPLPYRGLGTVLRS